MLARLHVDGYQPCLSQTAAHSSTLSACVLQSARFSVYQATHQADVWGILVVTSVVALTYNIVHSLMIQKTSAVTTTVLGEIKIVGLLLASFLILGAPC